MNKFLVLVVDDNLVSRLLPGFILRQYDFLAQVVECESGEQALALLSSHQVSHVLLDISMPGLDGIQVAQAMRAAIKHKPVSLIAYTADSYVAQDQYFKSLGFDDVLLKPLTSESLLKVLSLNG